MSPARGPAQSGARSARLRRPQVETLLAIVVGIVLGLGIVSAFVFAGSEGSIDAPRISGADTGRPTAPAPDDRRAPGRSSPAER